MADTNPKIQRLGGCPDSGAAGDRLAKLRASAARRLAALPQRDERPGASDRLAAALRRREEAERRHETMIARWRHKNEGTPETHEKANALPERRRQSPLHRMERLGKISADERAAAEEIAGVAERIRRAGSIRSASLETRVDFANSGRDQLVESLGRIRLDITYRAWREAIPHPRAMVLDMILTNQSFVQLARAHGMQWRTARRRLITALRMWPEMAATARRDVDREDVEAVYARLGAGELL
ncbi:MAG TPA: hypothetical protein VF485_18550 [Sphingomonas sp.]